MKWYVFLWILAVSITAVPVAQGQEITSFDPRGLVLGVNLGAASYDGDAAGAFDEVNTGLGLEAYYNLSAQFSMGLSFGTSKYGVFDENRNRLGVGFRYRFLSDRVSPYVGLGAQIVNGGEETGFGPAASLGIEFATSDRFSFFVEGEWGATSPDNAIDRRSGGSSLDQLLSLDAGVRVRLTQPKNPEFGVELDIPDTVLVGDITFLNARVTGEPSSEVVLSWQVEQMSSYRGPEVRHVFDYLGPQTITVAGRNDRYEVRQSGTLVVVEDVRYRNPVDPLLVGETSTEGRVRIVEIYGDRTPAVGEPVNYRVRLHPGAIWPVNYLWDMGDGARLMGNNVLQRYESPGSYTVTVVASNRLSTDTLSTQVLVRSPDAPPVQQVQNPSARPAGEPGGQAPRIRYLPGELRGTASVNPAGGGYGWVVGSFLDRPSAEQLVREFKVKGFRSGVIVDSRSGASTAYRVVVGQFATTARALAAKREVQRLSAVPLSLIDVGDPSAAVGAVATRDRPTVRPEPSEPDEEADSVNVDRTSVEAPPGEPVAVPPAAATPDTPESVEAEDAAGGLDPDVAGPELGSVKVYLRDERLLIFIEGISDESHGIRRVEYRVFAEDGSRLSNWSEISLVPPGRSTYGLQMHRVPVPAGLETDGGTVEIRAVNADGGYRTVSASVGAE